MAPKGYEAHDIAIRAVRGYGVALIGAIVAALLLAAVLLSALAAGTSAREGTAHPMQRHRAEMAGPRLQQDPAADRERQRAEERRLLEEYGWVDRAGGVVRIPIERAIDLILDEGLPVREGSR